MQYYITIYLKVSHTYKDVLNYLKVSESMLYYIISFKNIYFILSD